MNTHHNHKHFFALFLLLAGIVLWLPGNDVLAQTPTPAPSQLAATSVGTPLPAPPLPIRYG